MKSHTDLKLSYMTVLKLDQALRSKHLSYIGREPGKYPTNYLLRVHNI